MKIENILNPISTQELERRWTFTRQQMAERGLDALVMQNSQDYLGGYVRWFTDMPATNGVPIVVVFFRNAPMFMVKQGARGGEDIYADHPVYRGVGIRASTSAFPSVVYTGKYEAEIVVDRLRKAGVTHLGVVAPTAMYYTFGAALRDGLEGNCRISDETEWIDAYRAVKSDEEIRWIRRTAEMQDSIMQKVIDTARPGMRDFEITALAMYEGHLLGSEQGTFNNASAPVGVRYDMTAHRHEQARTIRSGDYWNLLIENNGPGGFYTEIARTLVFGKASSELTEAYAACREAQNATVSALRDGAACADVFAAHNLFMRRHNLPEEKRLFAHSQGYDLVERPLIRDDEPMKLRTGMNIAVHPAFKTSNSSMFVCDNYLITAGGAERLHRLPQRIYEI